MRKVFVHSFLFIKHICNIGQIYVSNPFCKYHFITIQLQTSFVKKTYYVIVEYI